MEARETSERLPVHSDFLGRCVERVPVAHALERCLECELFAEREFTRPVLDLGCGDGIFASVLFADEIDIGLDPNARELEVARSSGAYRTILQRGGADIPLPDESLATVFSNSVLEHIPDVEAVLREVHRVLAPEGRLYVTVPTHRIEEANLGRVVVRSLRLKSLDRVWRRFFRRIWHLYNVFTEDGWEARFADAGFVVDDSVAYQSLRMYRVREAVLPFSLVAFVTKKVANRWLLTPPAIRRLLVRPIARALRRSADRDASGPGYLMFYSLRKSSGS